MPNNSNLTKVIISFEHVVKTYTDDGSGIGLKDITFQIKEGEFVCIIGESGGGKSTLLKLITGIEEPTSGKVARPKNVSEVFQSYALLPWATVLDNVALILRINNVPEKDAIKESMHYLDMMGLRGFENRYPRELSGGQQQRVGIARALAVEPRVLLLDEPFSNLDPKLTGELHHDLIKIWSKNKKTVVMVSHSIEEAVALADKIILLKNFRVEKIFDINLRRPRQEQSRDFIWEVLKIRKEFFR